MSLPARSSRTNGGAARHADALEWPAGESKGHAPPAASTSSRFRWAMMASELLLGLLASAPFLQGHEEEAAVGVLGHAQQAEARHCWSARRRALS